MEFTPSKTLKRARNLRRVQTEAEKKFWSAARDRRVNGYKFTRQVPVGPYIVDFLCSERQLVVELDGATHGDVAEIAHDAARTRFLNAKGFRVLRFFNQDIYEALPDVLDAVLIELGKPT